MGSLITMQNALSEKTGIYQNNSILPRKSHIMFLVLTDPKPYDLEAFYEMNQDKNFQKEFLNLRGQTIMDAERLLDRIINRKKELQSLTDYAFVKLATSASPNDKYDKTNSIMIGFISIDPAGDSDQMLSGFTTLLNFGMVIKYCGKGLMTAALNTRFQKYYDAEITFLAALVMGDNPASERVLEKCGFEVIRELPMGTTFAKRISMSESDFQEKIFRN